MSKNSFVKNKNLSAVYFPLFFPDQRLLPLQPFNLMEKMKLSYGDELKLPLILDISRGT
jgi:hypothetical protein